MKLFIVTSIVCYILIQIATWFVRFLDIAVLDVTRINFNQWLDIYYINPRRWDIPSIDYLEMGLPRYEDTEYRYSRYVTFGFIGNIKYRRWAIKHNKQKSMSDNKNKENDFLIKILNNAQLDIDALRAKSEKEIDEVRKICENVTFRRDWYKEL